MTAKTPVSMLHEMMMKKGMVPNYDLTHDGGGTHINTFTYRVSCDGFTAVGRGRCKKDAKHTAAKNMLERIAAAHSYPQLPATPENFPVRTPLPEQLPSSPKNSPNEPFLNAIGKLKDLCATNQLQEPVYTMVSDVGPPHARIFTYHCTVSTFREEGRAMTKKQAKHEASRKMLDRLLEVMSDAVDPHHLDELQVPDTMDVTDSTKRAMSLYSGLSKVSLKRVHLGAVIKDYHCKLKNSFTDITVPTRDEVSQSTQRFLKYLLECQGDYCPVNLDTMKLHLDEFLAPMTLDYSCEVVDSDEPPDKVLIMKVNTIPDIVVIEIGQDLMRMEMDAIIKFMKTFDLLTR